MSDALTERGRELRRNATPSESILWARLRRRPWGFRFRRQQPIGPFIVDFYCGRFRLVIELDGESHDGKAVTDGLRQQYLEAQGLSVVRFWDSEVHENLEGVLETIAKHCGID